MPTDPSEQREPAGADARAPAASVSPSPGASHERAAVSTTRRRAEEQRRAKQELVRQQVESGSLVIRQMTAEERERFPVRSAPPKRPRGR